MKKRDLIIVNTYYQLIFALQLRLTTLKDDYVLLIITDHSRNAKQIYERLSNTHIFDDIDFVESYKQIYNRSFLMKIKDYFNITVCNSNEFKSYLNNIEDKRFDSIISYNYSVDLFGIYSILSIYNRDIEVSCMEESVFYDNLDLDRKIWNYSNVIRKAFRKPSISKHLKYFYCFYPSLYHGRLEAKRVPRISNDSRCAYEIKKIFNISEDELKYDEKYIYFSSVLDFEGEEPIGEFELVKKIAELVGKNNLLIKQHPRDFRNVYRDSGFKVDKNSDIPWEAIQLSYNFENHIFLTANSGSVLAGSLMTKNPVKTFYMFNFCNIKNNSYALSFQKALEKLLNSQEIKQYLSNVFVANNIEDILI